MAQPSLGKTWGMRRMATPEGHFTMVALDQRPPILDVIAAKRGIASNEVAFADMVTVKRVLAEKLTRCASAMLFDPNFGLPAALEAISPRSGLVVTLEEHRFEDTPGGRRSRSIDDWSVAKIKRAGADGVKLLAWYRPDASPQVLEHQQRYVERVGRECREHDIALVLELLVYPFAGRAGADAVNDPRTHAQLVEQSVREFCDPRYAVDLLKLQSPLPGATLPARDGAPPEIAAQESFDRIGTLCADAGIPWVMLSAAVTPGQFHRVLEYAYAAGASGFLAGRAVWGPSLEYFPDLAAVASHVGREAVAIMEQLEALTRRAAQPWRPDYAALAACRSEGDFCSAYR